METVTRIVFTGDFFRPSPWHLRSTQSHNTRWLRDLLSHQIQAATDLPLEMVLWRDALMADGRLDDAAITAIYRALGEDSVTIDGWARLYEADILASPIVRFLLREMFQNALVIGFELPTCLKTAFDAMGVPFIDCIVHPIRFLDDLALGFTSNREAVVERLVRYAIPEDIIRYSAGLVTATQRRGSKIELLGGAVLFVAQTSYDRSTIRNGRFVSIRDYRQQLLDIAAEASVVLVRPHPLEPTSNAIEALLALSPKIRLVDHNTYELLASERIAKVVAISSGVGAEAGYFEKEVVYLLKESVQLRQAASSNTTDGYIGVSQDFLSGDFWRDILGSITPSTPNDGFQLAVKPNRLRLSLRSAWGYEEGQMAS